MAGTWGQLQALWWSSSVLGAILTVLLLALLLAPPLVHLRAGWPARRAEIVDALSEEAVRRYFQQFFPTVPVPAQGITAFFEAHYNRRYGRRFYVLPFLILTGLATLLVSLCIRMASAWSLASGIPGDFRAVI